jgi:hypothetical protein
MGTKLTIRRGQDEHGNVVERYIYYCPGCKGPVALKIQNGNIPNNGGWTMSGTPEAPTFNPSVLTTANFGPEDGGQFRCHSWVRGGKIQFLGDCTHELKGQTVDMPDLPDWLLDDGG